MIDKKSPNSFFKYSGLAFQMIGILLIFTFIGKKTDEYLGFKTPWLTIVCILLALTGIFYKLIKDFSSK
ncbi:MAG: AtpZ/AtpI family protein [Bacteroidetes bacterium]|nr:AtpZ/AtpI family protein [Bacteroidota bacterium]